MHATEAHLRCIEAVEVKNAVSSILVLDELKQATKTEIAREMARKGFRYLSPSSITSTMDGLMKLQIVQEGPQRQKSKTYALTSDGKRLAKAIATFLAALGS